MGKLIYVTDNGDEKVLKADCPSEPIAVKAVFMETVEAVAADCGFVLTEKGKEELPSHLNTKGLEALTCAEEEIISTAVAEVDHRTTDRFAEQLKRFGLRPARCGDCGHRDGDTGFCYEYDGTARCFDDATECSHFLPNEGWLYISYGELTVQPGKLQFPRVLQLPIVINDREVWKNAEADKLIEVLRASKYGGELEDLICDLDDYENEGSGK